MLSFPSNCTSVLVKVTGHLHCMGTQHALLGGTVMSLIKATSICLNLLGLLINEVACCSCPSNQNSLFLWSIATGPHLAMKSVPKMKSKGLCVHMWNSCVDCLFCYGKSYSSLSFKLYVFFEYRCGCHFVLTLAYCYVELPTHLFRDNVVVVLTILRGLSKHLRVIVPRL